LLEQLISPWGVIGIASLFALVLVIPISLHLRRGDEQRRINKAIKDHADASIENAVIPDGIDGFIFADYLLRMRGNIAVLNCENRKGYIFGADHIDEWTCVEDKRTEKFNNPLRRASLFAQQCRHISGFDGIEARVLFGSKSAFPKGVPQGVVQMSDFERDLEALNSGAAGEDAVEQAWAKLVAMNSEARQQIDAVHE